MDTSTFKKNMPWKDGDTVIFCGIYVTTGGLPIIAKYTGLVKKRDHMFKTDADTNAHAHSF